MPRRAVFINILFVVSLIVWTVGLLMPVPKRSTEVLGSDTAKFILSKILHGTAYAYLAVLVGLMNLSVRQRWAMLGLLSGHAFLTEFLQLFVNRGASWRDVALDHFGISVGIAAGWSRWRVLFRQPDSSKVET